MPEAPLPPELIPDSEPERIAAVRRYDVLDTPRDHSFDRVTALAAKHFDVPISIVSIVDTDRIWFKSAFGLEDVREIGRDPGLCASAILQDDPWVIENGPEDPRTLANPLVAGEFGLRFYAGAPLRTSDGHNLGTLCVIDRKPREFSDEEATLLEEMAAIVVDELELRLAARRTAAQERALRRQADRHARALQLSLLPPKLPEISGIELAARELAVGRAVACSGFFDCFPLPADEDDRLALVAGDVEVGPGTLPIAAAIALARCTIRTSAMEAATPDQTLEALDRVLPVGEAAGRGREGCSVLVAFAHRAGDGVGFALAGAGGPPALIVRREGGIERLKPAGRLAGWEPDVAFDQVGGICARATSSFSTPAALPRSTGGWRCWRAPRRPLAGRSRRARCWRPCRRWPRTTGGR